MSGDPIKSSKRILEPHDRISEVLFGLIMVLTFTGSLSIAESGRDDIRTMLIGALGCNLAWGIIDGVLYLMGCLAEKGRNLMTLQAVRQATDPQKAQRLVAGALPPRTRGLVRFLAGLAIVLVAVSRVMLRAHWPSDVLGGIALGLALASAAALLARSARAVDA